MNDFELTVPTCNLIRFSSAGEIATLSMFRLRFKEQSPRMRAGLPQTKGTGGFPEGWEEDPARGQPSLPLVWGNPARYKVNVPIITRLFGIIYPFK